MFWRSGALALTLAVALPATAHATTDSQAWTTASVNVKLNSKWRLSEELTFRFSDNRNGLYEIENNTLLGYALSPTVTLAAGYTHDPQYSAGNFTILERRAREQVTVDKLATLGKGSFTGRLRAEQRWRDGLSGTGWRLRPFLRYSVPVAGKVKLVLSDEPFINLSTTSFQKQKGFERMRNFAGLSIPLSSKLSLEAGYLNQYFFNRNRPDESDHVASLTLSGNF
ncbi:MULTISPECIES: DUF2490 domain-containing protein [Sphingomonas]|uniref:DUF2490 domain-containing protein n=1 Tax=Sphingomonas TaxID=13687 RepID=UPI000DEED4FD|nr:MULTISPECIES: DUF2490 domain-containing protein [Sphingomonas]